ncbi:MAG: glycosyltransferase family 2 protein [Planctomycetota bacterium]|nr:glycosyltransferase family 2 protein [Planctomycetota bacterium]
MSRADLSVIIVSMNCRGELAECLASVERARGGLAVETFVVDNASRDASAAMVAERFPQVRLIANERNRGFAAANNQALALAVGRNVLFLNPDTVVRPGALEMLVRTLDGDTTLGVCAPQLLNADGSIQESSRREPSFAALLHQYTPLRLLRIFKGAYRRYKMGDFDFRRAADVEIVMGAAFCTPARVLAQVGSLDERFFVYFEEMDFCRRVREAGYRVRFEPSGQITHIGGVSAATATSNLFFCRSLFRYLRKHNGPVAGRAMVFTLRLGMFSREGMLLAGNLVAGGVLALVLQTGRAKRRMARARSAARFVFRDGWLTLFCA